MKKNQFKKTIPILIFATVISGSYAFGKIHASESSGQAVASGVAVKTITAEKSNGEGQLEISGFVRGTNRANIAPMMSGRILKIYKREGDIVRKGETIAIIDASQADAQTNAANNSVDALKKTLSKTGDYYDKLVNQTTGDAKKSAKKGRDLQKQMVKDQIVAAQGVADVSQVVENNSVLTAPFDGTITSMPVREGDFAAAGVPLVNIDSTKSLELETYVAATDGQKVSVGNVVQIQTSSENSVSGTVVAVSPAVDTQNLKTYVRIHIGDTTGSVHLGDFVRGNIKISGSSESSIEIPRKAVINRGGDPVVFVVDGKSMAEERVIKIGKEQNGIVPILQGVSEGEKVVVEGQFNLRNNTLVK
jgi:RND family efflux transporter MFP subunit